MQFNQYADPAAQENQVWLHKTTGNWHSFPMCFSFLVNTEQGNIKVHI